jgi:hypothetical protein
MNESGYAHASQVTGVPGSRRLTDTELVSNLQSVPPAERRRLAVLLLPVGLVLLAAGLVPVLTSPAAGWRVAGVAVTLLSLLLLGVAWGLHRSAATDDAARHEAELDAAIMAATDCGSGCGTGACGVDDCAVRQLPRR